MNILITGGTGFIGSRFVEKVVGEGHHVYVLTRNPKKHKDTQSITYISYQYSIKRLPFIHAVVNLAGESLFGYWTKEKKQSIIDSRIEVTEQLTKMMMQMKTKPHVFISGSAIGFYGTADNMIFTEKTESPSNDFLGDVTKKWEAAAHVAEDLGIRTVYSRFGVVLHKDAGALPQMALPVKYGVGGKIGSGEQWISWVHIDDCVNLLFFALMNEAIQGPMNITAPNPQRNKDFTETLAAILHRPNLMHVPSAVVKTVIGEMSQLITDGQYVMPKKAIEHGFIFHYEHLEDALADIYK